MHRLSLRTDDSRSLDNRTSIAGGRLLGLFAIALPFTKLGREPSESKYQP